MHLKSMYEQHNLLVLTNQFYLSILEILQQFSYKSDKNTKHIFILLLILKLLDTVRAEFTGSFFESIFDFLR